MEQSLQDYRVYTQETDQANISSVEVSPDAVEQANTPGGVEQSQSTSPTQQSQPTSFTPELGMPKDSDGQPDFSKMGIKPEVTDQANIAPPTPATPQKHSESYLVQQSPCTPQSNEQPNFSAITDENPLEADLASSAATRPQDTSVLLQDSQDTRKFPCTPGCKTQPRRYGPGTGEIRRPVNMTPSRIYRPSCSPGTTELLSSPVTPSIIVPIGELITSNGRCTYTLWAHKQPKPESIPIQILITNVNSTTSFKSWSGVSRRSPIEVLEDFIGLLRAQGIELVSLNVVKESFVAIVDTEKGWDELREGMLHAVR